MFFTNLSFYGFQVFLFLLIFPIQNTVRSSLGN